MAFTRPRAAQIDFDVTNISDPLIRLNSGETGSADKDVGIVIERGDDTNVAIIYDESADEFAIINTTETGTTSGNVTVSSYADIRAGTFYGDGSGLTGVTSYTDGDVASYLSANGYDTSSNIIVSITDSAPATLDTLNELAAALGDDANFATTTSTALGNRLRVDTAAQGLTGTQQTNALTNLGITATSTELNYVSGVTSAIQTQIDNISSSSFTLAADSGSNDTFTTGQTLTIAGGTGIDTTVSDNNISIAIDSTVATLTGSQTLTNKTLTSPIISSISNTGTLTLPTSTGTIALTSDIPTNNNQLTNGAGFTTNTGDITNVAVSGTGLSGGGASGSVTITSNATSANTGSTIVARDASGNFTAGTINATNVDISNSLDIGSEVVLTESTDRADLLLIKSTTSSWGGLQISNSSNEGLWSFMTDGTTGGIYDDENGDWAIQFIENSEVRLYHNGSEKLNTNSGGVTVTGVMTGTATSARYADLAEKYTTDADYDPGTVLIFGGEEEVTLCTKKYDRRIAGIVSVNPAYLMNNDLQNASTVALVGRVPCKVVGFIRKGDLMVSSDTDGHAEAWRDESSPPYGTVIGKSLENKDSRGTGVVEVVVGAR